MQIVNLAPTTLVALVVVCPPLPYHHRGTLLIRSPFLLSLYWFDTHSSSCPLPIPRSQCVDDFEERFPTEQAQAHILNLVKNHMGTEQAPTIVVHPSEGGAGKANGVHNGGDEEMDELAYEEEEEEGLVEEGLEGAGEQEVRGIDEEDA